MNAKAAAVAFALLAAAAVAMRSRSPVMPERRPPAQLAKQQYDPATVRAVRKKMTFDGMECSSCHDGSEPLQGDPKEKGVFHEAIKLEHGRNQHCFNCHHRKQPADFSNFDGAPIALARIELLCARCHGTTYRDWQQGSHGRRAGFWDASKGKAKPEVCIACHEPHSPVFKALEAAPPPKVNPRRPEGGHS